MMSRLLAGVVLAWCLAGCAPRGADETDGPLPMPALSQADYRWIAARIYANETGGRTENLAWWNVGEDFPSLGIGHFIWFPSGVDAPFDETFPKMFEYVRETSRCLPPPAWLEELKPFDAPWEAREDFDADRQSAAMAALREWLAATAPEQAQFIVASFRERWNALELPTGRKTDLTAALQQLLASPRGLFAVIDYFNFKGLGSNPRERYAGEGWGLVQVLGDVAGDPQGDAGDLVEHFSRAAVARLELRVANSPPERFEARWLEGWRERVAEYTQQAPGLSKPPEAAFRVTPYIQAVAADRVSIVWFSERPGPGRLTLRAKGATAGFVRDSVPELACELGHHLAEFRDLPAAQAQPYRHRVTIDGLEPGSEYVYVVEQDGETATGGVRTPGGPARPLRFVVYGDSETEPESATEHVQWPEPGREKEPRPYIVDQARGYAANVATIVERRPDFVAIAGDLVESGGEQRDWDEFWKHNAALAASVPIVPTLGNHEYFGGPGDLGGYSPAGARRALGKYRSYFGRDHYYRFDYGPVALLVLDANNGLPERSARDTNWRLDGADDIAPAWQEGSAQREWLEQALAEAQRDAAFTFVVMHPAPYTSGVHGMPPGLGEGSNFSSGLPLRELTPLFLARGVDAVFSGHDEQYEHSAVTGTEQPPGADAAPHTVHFYTVGIGGDGLRGPEPGVSNPYRLFLAHADAPERRDEDGALDDGGKHYGHIEVNVVPDGRGGWQARLEPVYLFPVVGAEGGVERFERRVYADTLVLDAPR